MSAPGSVELELERPEGPLEAGRVSRLALSVRASRPVLLDSVLVEPAPFFAPGPAFSWRTFPEGVVCYDAARDRYVHRSGEQAVSAVPLHTGVLPTGRAECFVPVRPGSPPSVRLVLTVRYHEGDLPSRLYRSPERGLARAQLAYELAASLEGAPGACIVRCSGLAMKEDRLELELPVQDAPVAWARAAERGRPLGRSRALGGWVVSGPRGLELVSSDVCQLGAVELAVLDHLDGLRDDPIVAVFLRPRASSVAKDLGCELNAAGQGEIEIERARELLERARDRGAHVELGPWWEGVRIS